MTAHAWAILVGAAVAALAVGDVLLLCLGGVQATISRHTIALFARYPILQVVFGLAVGVLVGHLAWPQPTPGLCP